jgi:hypothetical protein
MSRDLRPPVDILHYEIVQEQASALGRMGRTLEQALTRLREFDAAHAASELPASMQPARRKLVLEAGQALWMLVVQREAPGTVEADLDMSFQLHRATPRSPPVAASRAGSGAPRA